MLRDFDNVGRVTIVFVRVWLSMVYVNVGDEVLFIKYFKQRLMDYSIQKWSAN